MATFKSFLSAVGHDVKAVFGWLGSAQGQATIAGVEGAATTVVTAVNPALGAGLVGIEALVNAGLKQAVQIEAVATAAGAQSGTGEQKAAAVISSIAPSVSAFLESIGVNSPTAGQVQTLSTAISNGLVTILNAVPAPPSTNA